MKCSKILFVMLLGFVQIFLGMQHVNIFWTYCIWPSSSHQLVAGSCSITWKFDPWKFDTSLEATFCKRRKVPHLNTVEQVYSHITLVKLYCCKIHHLTTAIAKAMAKYKSHWTCHWTSWCRTFIVLELCWHKLAIIFFAPGSVILRITYTFMIVSEWKRGDDTASHSLFFCIKKFEQKFLCFQDQFGWVHKWVIWDCYEPILEYEFFKIVLKAIITASSSNSLEQGLSLYLWKSYGWTHPNMYTYLEIVR